MMSINTVANDVELGSNGMSSNLGKKVVNDVVAPYIEINTVGAISSNATNKNNQGTCDPKVLAAGRYFFIASCIAHIKDAWGNNHNQKIAHGIKSDGLYIITPVPTPSSSSHSPSVNTIKVVGICRSLRRELSQVISQEQSARALYLASMEDLDITDCFFDCHEIKLLPRKIPNPVTDLLE
ncbi:hypothetical protein Tco_1577723 [Tanacetum coccineum]